MSPSLTKAARSFCRKSEESGFNSFVAVGVETKYLLDNLRVKGERTLRRVIAPRANPCEERK